jgi:hypothetical protein
LIFKEFILAHLLLKIIGKRDGTIGASSIGGANGLLEK